MAYKDKAKEKEHKRLYRLRRKEEIKEYNKIYFSTPEGREAKRRADKKYRESTKGKLAIKKKNKHLYLKNTEKNKEYARQYRKTPKGKEAAKAHWERRHRELGFEPLNEPFDGSVAHHINKNETIYIPEEIHKSIRHNLKTGYNMNKINKIAVYYLTPIRGEGGHHEKTNRRKPGGKS